ncbi:hypothetical protein ACJW31_12G172100 [Castanea mollissima]
MISQLKSQDLQLADRFTNHTPTNTLASPALDPITVHNHTRVESTEKQKTEEEREQGNLKNKKGKKEEEEKREKSQRNIWQRTALTSVGSLCCNHGSFCGRRKLFSILINPNIDI